MRSLFCKVKSFLFFNSFLNTIFRLKLFNKITILSKNGILSSPLRSGAIADSGQEGGEYEMTCAGKDIFI